MNFFFFTTWRKKFLTPMEGRDGHKSKNLDIPYTIVTFFNDLISSSKASFSSNLSCLIVSSIFLFSSSNTWIAWDASFKSSDFSFKFSFNCSTSTYNQNPHEASSGTRIFLFSLAYVFMYLCHTSWPNKNYTDKKFGTHSHIPLVHI